MSALSDLVKLRRDEAATAGRPTLRIAAPSVVAPLESESEIPLNTLFVWLRGGKLTLASSTIDEMKFTPGLVTQFLNDQGGRVVATDRTAFNSLLRSLERFSAPAGKACARQLRACGRLPISTRVVVLSEALERRFWMPAGSDPTSIIDWKRVFAAPSGAAGVRVLLAAAEADHSPEKTPGTLKTAVTSIRRLTETVKQRSLYLTSEAAIDGFLAAERIGAAWEAIRTFDVIGRHEAVAEGTASLVKVVGRNDRSDVLGILSQPCRMKPGSVILLDTEGPERVGSALLVGISYDPAQGLMGSFRPAPANDPQKPGKTKTQAFGPLDRATLTLGELIIVNEPFLSTDSSDRMNNTRFAKWNVGKEAAPQPVRGRVVPLDVAFAGGVEADSI